MFEMWEEIMKFFSEIVSEISSEGIIKKVKK